MKNTNTQKLDQGRIDSALGKILKLREGPDSDKSVICTFCYKQKCPKYMNIFKADSIPQTIMLRGIKYSPSKCFYLRGFKLDRFTIPPDATDN